MEREFNIVYRLKCHRCELLATLICGNCFGFKSCEEHKDSHCGCNLVNLKEANSVLYQNNLVKKLKKTSDEIYEKFSNFSTMFNKVEEGLRKFYNDSFKVYIEALQNIESFLAGFGNDQIIIQDDLLLVLLNKEKEVIEFTVDIDKRLFKLQEILQAVDSKSFKYSLSRLNDIEKNSSITWKQAKEGVFNNIAALSDFIMDIEDDSFKFNLNKIELNSALLKQVEFYKDLPKICPNIYWIKGDFSATNMHSFFEVVPCYTSLTNLEIRLAKAGKIDINLLLKSMSQLKYLTSLSIDNIFIDNENIHEDFSFRNLAVVVLGNNCVNSSSLVKFLRILNKSRNLQFLTIKNNSLETNNLSALLNLLESSVNLRYLSLVGNTFDKNLSSLVGVLVSINRIIEFHLCIDDYDTKDFDQIYLGLFWPNLYRLVVNLGLDISVITQLKSKGVLVHFRSNGVLLDYN